MMKRSTTRRMAPLFAVLLAALPFHAAIAQEAPAILEERAYKEVHEGMLPTSTSLFLPLTPETLIDEALAWQPDILLPAYIPEGFAPTAQRLLVTHPDRLAAVAAAATDEPDSLTDTEEAILRQWRVPRRDIAAYDELYLRYAAEDGRSFFLRIRLMARDEGMLTILATQDADKASSNLLVTKLGANGEWYQFYGADITALHTEGDGPILMYEVSTRKDIPLEEVEAIMAGLARPE